MGKRIVRRNWMKPKELGNEIHELGKDSMETDTLGNTQKKQQMDSGKDNQLGPWTLVSCKRNRGMQMNSSEGSRRESFDNRREEGRTTPPIVTRLS